MKLYFTLTFLFTVLIAQAQTTYFEDKQMWGAHYSYYYLGLNCATIRNTTYYVNGDTTFNNIAYKRIGQRSETSFTQFGTFPCSSPYTNIYNDFMFVRQTNDSIMSYDPWFGTESLFIDYNLGVGDTFKLTQHVIDTFVVEAITIEAINGQNHRVFHVDTLNNYSIIEGVGFIGSNASEMFQPIHFMPDDNYYTLSCYAQHGVTQWTNPTLTPSPCNYLFYLSSKEEEFIPLKVYPNPSAGYFTIEGLEMQSNVSVYSYDGRLIFQQEIMTINMDLDLSHLNSGIYLLVVGNKSTGLRSERLIIQ